MPGIASILHDGADPGQARVTCVLLHGRGQTPEDMQATVIRRLPPGKATFVLPAAADRCWYRALAVSPLTDDTRGELAASLAGLARLIADLRAQAPARPVVLAGFSQGACLALEHAFSGQAAPDAVVALTGCRVGVAGDARAAALPPGLPVYLSAGQDDSWIPPAAFAQAALELGAAGAALRLDVFPGRAHLVSDPEIAMLHSVLADLAAGRPPRFEVPR